MQESLRQYYVNQLGIVSYQSRCQLPGAALSLEPVICVPSEVGAGIEAIETEKIAAHSQGVESSGISASIASNDARHAFDDLNVSLEPGEKKQRAGTEKVEKILQRSGLDTAASKGFQLSIWRLSSDILVVESEQPQLALPTKKLLSNIIFALGYQPKDLASPELLRWPLQQEMVGEQLDDEGRAMVQAYYEAQINKYGFKHLLLMGESAIRYSLESEVVEGKDLKHLYGQHLKLEKLVSSANTVTAIMVPSLVEMLQQPLTKKITWQAIQSLLVRT